MRSAIFFVALVATAALSGCGGGGTSATATGRAVFTVVWPAPSRLIPAASNSIRVEMVRNGVVLDSKLLSRPVGGGSATAVFDGLPVGALLARAQAYPQADGTGVAQASGTVPLTTVSGQTVNFSLTMGSTVAAISLAAPSLVAGQQGQMQVTARDASAAIVLLTPSKLQWSSDNTAVLTVNGTGQVTAVATGVANVTATDTESGKSGSLAVGVAPANTVLNPANGHYYAAVDTATLITWSQAKAAAAAMRFNGWAGHLVTLTSAPENDFVASHFPGDSVKSYWTGGFQDHSAANYAEPAGGWKWITGEAWSFTNWHSGEPNDPGALADFLNLFPDSTWNDTTDSDGHGFGYIVEFEP
jgi:hypothetical protein